MKYMPRRIDLLNDMFDDFFPRSFENMEGMMKTDIYQKDGYYNLDVDIPGYNKEDINMEISDGYLTIKAVHNTNSEENDDKGNIIRRERTFGSCQRSFFVGDSIKAEDITAKFNNGVLSISLPSVEQKRIETAQRVEIQ